MKKETAIEWLGWQLNTELFYDIDEGVWNRVKEIFEQALQMEREQIVDAFGVGCQVESTRLIGYHDIADQYYEQTYGGLDE